ncbi:glycosyltransferase family 4 protein [Marinobacter bohaiensis]|uniref:glycosyltransferase family 4 protein n=1 Tax=Marinobacter bohaiensis TaxID=2201898 RepID=UPI000DAE572A|nr:glycosyltransferase family 4 protein [Marinobacter bohaiensis]
MKILIVNTFYTPIQVGGAELSVQQLAEGFAARGHTVGVLTLSRDGVGDREEINGVTVIRVPSYNHHIPLISQGSLTERTRWHLIDVFQGGDADKYVDLSEFDVIHTNNLLGFSTQFWKTIRQQKRDDAVMVHNIRDFYLRCQRSNRYRNGTTCQKTCTGCLPAEVTRRRHSECVDAAVGVSDYMLQHHLEAGFFPNARRTAAIHNRPGDHLQFPRAERQHGDPIRVGFIGRVAENKGTFILAEAFRKLARRDMTLDIAGTGSDADVARLQDIIAGDERITYLGKTQPADFYPRMDVMVMPSTWEEPLSRVVSESLLNGIPVLACNLGGQPEMVRHEQDGLVFTPTVANIHDALAGLTRERLAELTRNARLRSPDMLAANVIDQYLNLFGALLEEQSAAKSNDRAVGL